MKYFMILLGFLLIQGMVYGSVAVDSYSFATTKIQKEASTSITVVMTQTVPLITFPSCGVGGCGIIFEDFNGFVYDTIPGGTNFENDLNCGGSSCIRFGTCLSTCTFTVNIFAVNQNSRLIRSCYYRDVNVSFRSACARIQALHAYDTPTFCIPSENGNFEPNNRTCVYKRFTNAFTNTDMNVRIDANLTLYNSSRFYLNQSTIDYNYFQNTDPTQHKTIVGTGSKIFDYNVVGFPLFHLNDT